jgi:hypothetical protein
LTVNAVHSRTIGAPSADAFKVNKVIASFWGSPFKLVVRPGVVNEQYTKGTAVIVPVLVESFFRR